MDITVNIRSIQHYMYCPRRYALLEVNNDWAENAFVVKANIMHENVHDGSHSFSDSNKIVRSAVSIYNDELEYDLYGITDCIEFVKSANGTFIEELSGKYDVRIVEYKPKPPKDKPYHESDAIQVFAQKLCVDYVFGCDSEGYIYYSETKKRIKLPFKSDYERYDIMLKEYLFNMRKIISENNIPPKVKGQKCSGCSIQDVCFPKEKKYNVKQMILSKTGDDSL